MCKCFVGAGSSPALLDIPDIETLGALAITYEAIGRQLTSDKNADKRKRDCQL